jgi:type I restriction enzyme, R subunit
MGVALPVTWRYRDLLRPLEFAVVFSSGNNDDSAWAK